MKRRYLLMGALAGAMVLLGFICPADISGYMLQQQPSANPLKPDYTKTPMQPWEKLYADFSFAVFKQDGHTLPYRFYKPKQVARAKKLPLVIFFHGAGERGDDNRYQFYRFNANGFWKKHPCYIIAPHCPQKEPDGTDGVWVNTPFGAASHTMRSKPTWELKLAMALIDEVSSKYKIDKSRIYITGLSMGGFATWEVLQRRANTFAAAIPICGGGDPAYAEKMTGLPIWVFHGDKDDTVPVKRSRDMVNAIKAAGGNVIYTEYPYVGHDAWTATYSDPAVWDWLFAQKKTVK